MERVTRIGWSAEKVEEQYRSYIERLTEDGYECRECTPEDLPHVEALVREHVPGAEEWFADEDASGVIAIDKTGAAVGCAVASATRFSEDYNVTIQHLVVAPEHRGRGIGFVLLEGIDALAQRLLGPVRFTGYCAAEHARFYQRAGYDVLQPGERLLMGPRVWMELVASNPAYTYPFYRDSLPLSR